MAPETKCVNIGRVHFTWGVSRSSRRDYWEDSGEDSDLWSSGEMPRKRKEEMERDLADGKQQKPQQRNAANARERSRMRVLSKAFSRLKTTLPWVPPDTKLSKLDTLRLASSYIAHLKQILDHEDNMSSAGFIHPLNLTWPFTFNGRTFGSSHHSPPMGSRDSCHGDSSNGSISDTSPAPERNMLTNHIGVPH
ncbi:hypothetical protein Btru_040782 [Bulinus truncatus]|nr:hypothetical protein Btru_040782 [Bulinus truncatus]